MDPGIRIIGTIRDILYQDSSFPSPQPMVMLFTNLHRLETDTDLWVSQVSGVKNPPANAGDTGLISGSGRFSGEGNGDPLQYSCLEHPMDRGSWWATVHRVAKESDTTE